jgi:hypothetical protein
MNPRAYGPNPVSWVDPLGWCVYAAKGKRIGSFFDDDITGQIINEKIVYVTDKVEKSALKKYLHTNPNYQKHIAINPEQAVQVRYLHGYDVDAINNAAAQLLNPGKRVSNDITILGRQKVARFETEVHVGSRRGPHVHVGRNSSTPLYIRLDDPGWYT